MARIVSFADGKFTPDKGVSSACSRRFCGHPVVRRRRSTVMTILSRGRVLRDLGLGFANSVGLAERSIRPQSRIS